MIGVDMTPEMVSRARAQATQGGHHNVEFRLGEIEHLPVADATADVLISNCVINLSPDKRRVFGEAFRVLRPGGRLALTDLVATETIPADLTAALPPLLTCTAGAASVQDLRRWLQDAGFGDVRITVNEASRSFIRGWAPDSGLERYIASATIEATRPGSGPPGNDPGPTGTTASPALALLAGVPGVLGGAALACGGACAGSCGPAVLGLLGLSASGGVLAHWFASLRPAFFALSAVLLGVAFRRAHRRTVRTGSFFQSRAFVLVMAALCVGLYAAPYVAPLLQRPAASHCDQPCTGPVCGPVEDRNAIRPVPSPPSAQ